MATRESPVDALIQRSNRLGADRRITNYSGGNTSATGVVADPISGDPVELLWVKGSGGDLGTLRADGLAVLRMDRVHALRARYRGPDTEDEMVPLWDFCRHGMGGAAPSIDTAMHALVPAAHVDHLHPDAGIAIATARDGERLTREIFDGKVAWVPWRRPGFQLGIDIADLASAHPELVGAILGGHGITAWGATSAEVEARSRWIIDTATVYLERYGRPDPFGASRPDRAALTGPARRAKAAALAPHLRALASTDAPQVGDFSDDPAVLELLAASKLEHLAALGTSCPDHFLRTKVEPLVVPVGRDEPVDAIVARLPEVHAAYRARYAAYYERGAAAVRAGGSEPPPMRGADPAVILVPGVGMFAYGRDKATARVAGEFYRNAIQAMRGAESVSAYTPIGEHEKFRIEYWTLEEAKLQRLPKPRPLATRIALITGGASGIGLATARRLAVEGACVAIADLDAAKAQAVATELGGPDIAIGIGMDVTDEDAVRAGIDATVLAFGGLDLVVNNAGLSLSKALLETTAADWDVQHSVMARGSFLVAREAARVLIRQGLGGDIVYISSKNSVFAGPNNVAYSATKADQAHQVRLLAAELGEHGIRVNGINPDGVVRGSGIFAGGWGAKRAAVYGVPEEQLGEYYAQRTLLKREVLPEHVANAVFVLCTNELDRTTGLHIPVDGGVAAAFLR